MDKKGARAQKIGSWPKDILLCAMQVFRTGSRRAAAYNQWLGTGMFSTSVVDPEWFFSEPIPDPDPTPDPLWIHTHTHKYLSHTHIYTHRYTNIHEHKHTYIHTHIYCTLLVICNYCINYIYQDEPCITFVSNTVIYIYVCVCVCVYIYVCGYLCVCTGCERYWRPFIDTNTV